jgi:hypothetical protein
MYYLDGKLQQHSFNLSHRASQILGKDRAEFDAREFARDFSAVANIAYCGPVEDVPEKLIEELNASLLSEVVIGVA